MAEPTQDEPITPVLFRVHRAPASHGSDVTAVFPCEPWDRAGRTITCYAHIGQHGACDFGWYRKTRPAKPEEYAALKRELEADPFNYRLKIYQRMTRQHRNIFNETVMKGR